MNSQDTGSNQAGQDVGAQQPDQQTLYQQHLAHWQASFQEYWKCMASQGAAMPQQWAAQAMMGGGYGGMPYYGGGLMSSYGGMMNTGPPAAAGRLPAAHVPPLVSETCDTAPAAAPLPVITATTATSSQAGLPGNGMDSDADSMLLASDDGDMLLPVLDPAASTPLDCDDMQLQQRDEEARSPDIAVDPADIAALATMSPNVEDPAAAAIPSSLSAAPGAVLPAASRALPATSAAAAPAPLAAAAPTIVLPATGVIAAAPPAAATSVGAVGLPVMGLAQPAALAAVSQAAAQLSNMADAGGLTHPGLVRHHSATLSLLAEDGLPLDDKDLKRLRRKQSNRESARRSRLRKQAENDTLQQRLHDCETQRNSLIAENAALKQRMEQLTMLIAKLSQDKAALVTQVRGLGGQVAAEVEATPVTTISSVSADTLQQQIAAAAAVSQAVAASHAALPTAAVPTPAATLAAVAGLPEQLHPHNIQPQSMAAAAPQSLVAAAGSTAELATAILASA